MNEDMSLFMERLKKGRNFVFLMIIMSIACSLAVSNFISIPDYRATVQLLVGGERQDVKTLDRYALQDEMEFLNTYKEIIKSSLVLEEVNESANLNLSMSELKEGITVDFEKNSQVFNISFEHENYETAVLVANTAAVTFLAEAENVMNTNTITLLAMADTRDEATPTGIDPGMKLLLAILAAVSAGLGLVFFLPEMNNSIRTGQDAEELLSIPVIGHIPQISKKNLRKKQATLRRR